jgi:tetrahydromethanopterin S-methyltransferase subunit E
MSAHKSFFVKIGTAIGGATGLERGWNVYWSHFKEETWIRVVDAIVICAWTTIVGTLIALTVTLIWNNKMKEREKEDKETKKGGIINWLRKIIKK